jgi:mono/diheme cytochrome c family protein
MKPIKTLFITAICLGLLACSDDKHQKSHENSEAADVTYQESDTILPLAKITLTPKPVTNRWYFSEQADRGQVVFTSNCVACHGKNAEATADWKTPDANGAYPPPPLNGSAHAWHHPLSVLGRTIYLGGAPVGGQMPAFKDVLSETEIIDVIAHLQSYWSDAIYERWLTIENSSRQ